MQPNNQSANQNTIFCCLGGLLIAGFTLAFCATFALLTATRLAGGGVSAGQAAGSRPEISTSIETVYYRIEGDMAWDLRRQMDRHGPLDDDGRRWSALTDWHIHWRYRYVRSNGQCAAGPVTVELEINYTLPNWRPPASAPEELVERWDAYMVALQTHEDGHAEIAAQAAQAVQETMRALPAYPTCQALEREADALGESILDDFRQRQAEYDRLTEHGKTQGAHFP